MIITVEGVNFIILVEGRKTRVGFFTTIVIPESINDEIINLCEEIDDKLANKMMKNDVKVFPSYNSFYYIYNKTRMGEINEIDCDIEKGFSFYKISYLKYLLNVVKLLFILLTPRDINNRQCFSRTKWVDDGKNKRGR